MTSESHGAARQEGEKPLHGRTGSERVTGGRQHTAQPAINNRDTARFFQQFF